MSTNVQKREAKRKEKQSSNSQMEKIVARSFNEKVNLVLHDADHKDALYKAMRTYQKSHDIHELVDSLKSVLDEPDLLSLYEDIRTLIPPKHQLDYSLLAPKVPASKPRLVRLVKVPGEGFGFAVRGGIEHGIGVFVSHVVQGSQADRQGLQVGDELLRVNGFSIQEAVHHEVLTIIKAHNELVLKVRNVGMLPVKDNNNEHVTWRYVDNIDKTKTLQEVLDGQQPQTSTIEAKLFICLPLGAPLGCSVTQGHDDGIYVQSIQKDSYAEEAGMRVGDQILQVNGTPFVGISHSEAVVALKGSRHLNFIIRRGHNSEAAEASSKTSKLSTSEERVLGGSVKRKQSDFTPKDQDITVPRQQDLILHAIKALEQKEEEAKKEVKVHHPQSKPSTSNAFDDVHMYASIDNSPTALNITKSVASSETTTDNKSRKQSQTYHSADDGSSYRIQKPVLLHPTSRASQGSSLQNNGYEEILSEKNFNPNRLFTNEQIAGRSIKLITIKKTDFKDLGVIIEKDSCGTHSGIIISELYEGGAFHKHGGISIKDEILLVDGVLIQSKSMDDAKEILQNSFKSTPKVPMQLVIAKAPGNHDIGPDVLPRPDYFDDAPPISNLDDYMWEDNLALSIHEEIPVTII